MKLRRTATYVTSLLAAVTLALTGASAAAAADAQAAGGYVALGDSYSSGVGAGSYDSGSGDCRRTPKAYPALWAAANSPASFDFVACSGAVTSDVLNKQMGPLNSSTSLVSLTIGGNDAGFADVMTTCVLQSEANCIARVNTAKAFVEHPARPARLGLLAGPRQGPLGQRRRPRLPAVLQAQRHLRGRPDRGERTAINGAADLLNSVISKRAADHGYAYGDIAAAFTGHEICSGDSWLHSVKWTGINDSYHPTAAGQSGGYLPVLNSKA